MANNFEVSQGVDIDTSIDAIIPTGAMVAYGHSSFLSAPIDTLGICPCDGRALSTYTYQNLHKVISNTYGGTAYSNGVTNIASSLATFNVPNIFGGLIKYISGSTAGTNNLGTYSESHSHSASTEATVTAVDSSFDHGHYWSSFSNGTNQYHAHYMGGFYFGNSNIASPSIAKTDGTQAAAAINHAHSGYVPSLGWGGNIYHDHYSDGNMYTAAGTSHGHTATLSSTASTQIGSFPYASAYVYIKL